MIKATVGRVVWYHPADSDPTPKFRGEPLAAIVARVHSDRLINLTVFRADGITYGRHDVQLVQDGDQRPTERFAEWMPFQKGQAMKTDELEKAHAVR